MSFDASLQDLLDEGRVRISASASFTDDELQAAEQVLLSFERRYRADLPDTPPAISLPAAMWAAQVFYRACQCLAFREITGEEAQEMLRPFSGQPDAGAHYSVDLTLRLLPDLLHRSRTTSRDDPLVEELLAIAHAWPLSSVGVSGVEVDDLEPILDNECLRRVYVDRIIARNDRSRLSHPRVREAVMEAVGMHEELAPQMVAAVREPEPQDESE